ncbi:PTS sugar transporter subunit IIB [Salinicoccus carnicancri]|uniref:PTS sugar transporter subunit IIB n=1 Tax=Salinicoccus carnicancri TaxID=558170 RepID=UPI000477C7F0|nr:PTS sugar transporter subunit IIB [Salinicoccus carnicancri]
MRIILVCSAGMSTSILVRKMRNAAEERGMEADVNAMPESELHAHAGNVDVVLIGPQVRYLEDQIKEKVKGYDVAVAVIDQMAYGMARGEKVLDQALELKSE